MSSRELVAGGDACKAATVDGHEGKQVEEGRERREEMRWVRWRQRQGEVTVLLTLSL